MNADYDVKCYSGTTRRQSELAAGFNLVAPEGNWKNPICTILPTSGTDRGLIHDAIVHFTGSIATFEEGPVVVVVTAPGYYAAVGA